MLQSRKWAISLLVMAFVAGAFAGALLYSLALDKRIISRASEGEKSRHYDKQRVIEFFTKELNLTPEQRQQLSPILDQSRERWQKFYEEMESRREMLKEQTRAEIMRILNEEQKRKFQAHIESHKREKKSRTK